MTKRPLWQSIRRGLARRCPACGEPGVFRGYLKVTDACQHCGEPLGLIRADDFPPYLTIFAVGHLVVPTLLLVEQNYQLSMGLQLVIWPSLTLVLTLLLLRPIKGGVLGLMWALRLRGDESH